MKLLSLLLILWCSHAVFAGSNDATIVGKTESGRTEIDIKVGDIEGLIRSIKLTIDGQSYEIFEANSLNQTVIRDHENGFYVLVIEDADRVFRLWMIPGTETILKDESGEYKSRFAAIIEASDPREENKWKFTPRITIGCRLDWSI